MEQNELVKYQCISSGIEKIVATLVVNESYSKIRVHNNLYLVNKIKKEIKSVTEEEIQEIIEKSLIFCQTARKKGFYHLIEHNNLFDNQFIKDILYALSEEGYQKQKGFCWLKLTSIFLPYLKSDKFIGKEFIEGILIYEGILLSCNMYNPSQVKYSLNLLVGKLLEFDGLFNCEDKPTFPYEREGARMSDNILNEIEARVYDFALTLQEEYKYIKSSIVNNGEIYTKYREECEKISENVQICILEKILKAVTEAVDTGKILISNKTNSIFQKNLLKTIEISSKTYSENVQLSEYCLSYFLNCKETGNEYFENILYYEAFIMFANSYPLNMIKYRLYGMIGINTPFIDC